jgi:ABC-type multidrug transport system permease subunit
MNDQLQAPTAKRYSPLWQLVLSRIREFLREPEALFWVYGFPILMIVALGIAFRNKPVERITVDVEQSSGNVAAVHWVREALQKNEAFQVHVFDEAGCRLRLRTGKTDLVIVPTEVDAKEGTKGHPRQCRYLFDPSRPEGLLARARADDVLQVAAGRRDPLPAEPVEVTEPGGRYIDFLVPGLVGMSLLGGGMWGLGFVTVDMRIRKLLKRFLATPMRKSDFLLGLLLSRLVFMIPEVLLVLLFGWLAFGVVIQGSLLAVGFLILLGSFTFSGLGLLVASRAQTLEAVSGLMNLVMLPMWILSGIFFSPDRFPDVAQPFIRALPLTPLIEALRNVILEGASLWSQWPQITILTAYAVGSFALALRWFRWN